MSANALLKFNTKRARRMTEDEARAQLVSLGFDLDGAASVPTRAIGLPRRPPRDRRLGVLPQLHQPRRQPARGDRALLTVTFSI